MPGSICSMKGVIVRMTNRTERTRMTPKRLPTRPNWWSTVANGMPYTIGGIRIGRRKVR